MAKLAGQVALITGASSGVGWQTARQLAEQGVRLCLTARRQPALESLQKEIHALGGRAIVVPGDITNAADVERVVATCTEALGGLDILVNVPSVQLFAHFEDYAWDEITRMMDVNFYGYLRTSRQVLPHFRRQGRGHIINVLSLFSQMGFPLFSVYAASKHALLGWADSLRLELRGSGIDVSNVLLPAVATPFYDVAPTKLACAPRPAPPVYSTEMAASAVIRCIRHPHPHEVPVWLQGKLALPLRRAFPRVADAAIARFGPWLFTSNKPVQRPHGNMFRAQEPTFGPHGSHKPTPALLRYGLPVLALAAVLGARRWGHKP